MQKITNTNFWLLFIRKLLIFGKYTSYVIFYNESFHIGYKKLIEWLAFVAQLLNLWIFKCNPCFMCNYFWNMWRYHTDKKEKKIFLKYKKIQNGAVAKS